MWASISRIVTASAFGQTPGSHSPTVSSRSSFPFETSDRAIAPLKDLAMLAIRIGESIFGFAPVSMLATPRRRKSTRLRRWTITDRPGGALRIVDDLVECRVEPAAAGMRIRRLYKGQGQGQRESHEAGAERDQNGCRGRDAGVGRHRMSLCGAPLD